jgi:hypothetical protein
VAARRLTPAEAEELLELDARMERLKIGIGGAVITVAWAAAGTRDREEAEARIEALTGEALAVRLRIQRLRPTPPRLEAPTEPLGAVGAPGEWPPPPGGPTVTVAAAAPATARHVNIYAVPASAPRH